MAVSTLSAPPASPALSGLARHARNHRLDADAQLAYGLALLDADGPDAALPWLEAAARLQPHRADHQINLSVAEYRRKNLDGALYYAKRAHEIDPSSPTAAFNIASLYVFWAEPAQAVPWFERVVALQPEHLDAWSCLIFALDFLSTTTAEMALDVRRRFAAACEAPRRAQWPRHAPDLDPERRLRIGFTGGDFRDHSAAYMYGPIFEHLDRERYWTVCYADQATADGVTDWFRASSNGWRDVTGWPDELIARAVRQDRIDVLVDLAGFTKNSHLGVHLYRPAPLSVTAWGHLTGTGLQAMDGIVVDRVILPEDRVYEVDEAPLYVPYALGLTVPTSIADTPILPRPEGRPLTFGYFGRIAKVPDEALRLWADLLISTPGSRLMLKDNAWQYERTRTRVLETLEATGLDVARVELRGGSPRGEHLAAYNEIDVALDTWPESGGCTSLEALWMGRPIVTLPGERLISRITSSALTQLDLTDWIAEDVHAYVRIAQTIADQGGESLRARLLASPICDEQARTRAFEGALRGLWQRYAGRSKEGHNDG